MKKPKTYAGTAGVVSDDNSAVDGPPCDSAMVFSDSLAVPAGRRLAMVDGILLVNWQLVVLQGWE